MYHKMKNTLAGLGFVAAFVAGGLLFADPVPGAAPHANPLPAPTTEAPESALAMAIMRTALSVAQQEILAAQAAQRRARRGSQLRLQAGMPYYSFGALLPRRQES